MSATIDPMSLTVLPVVLESDPYEAEEVRLVRAAQDGHRDSFGRLYEIYAPMIHGVLLSRAPRHEVDDLVHEVFLSALKKIRSLRDPQAFSAWIAEIARNSATDRLRQAGRRPEVPLVTGENAPGNEPSTGPSQRERTEAAAILDAIRALPESYCETLTLRLVEGMTGPEIARKTGLTPGSVRVNLHRGMKLLRAAIEGTTA